MIGPNPWTVTLDIEKAVEANGVAKFWARRKIADLEVGSILRPNTKSQVDQDILSLALQHHLVSRLTSLVAVEKTTSRSPEQQLTRADVPLNLPEGWDFDKVFGGEGQSQQRADTGAAEQRDEAPLSLLQRQGSLSKNHNAQAKLAKAIFKDHRFSKVAQAGAPRNIAARHKLTATGVALPQTATDAQLKILFGLFALLLSSIILFRPWIFSVLRGEWT